MKKQYLSVLTILIICLISACGLKSDITEKSIYHQVSEFHDGTKIFFTTQKEESFPQLISNENNVVTINWNNEEWVAVYKEGSYEQRKEELKEHICDDYGNSFIAVYDGGGEATTKINDKIYVSIPFQDYQKAIGFVSRISYEYEGISAQVIPKQKEITTKKLEMSAG